MGDASAETGAGRAPASSSSSEMGIWMQTTSPFAVPPAASATEGARQNETAAVTTSAMSAAAATAVPNHDFCLNVLTAMILQ